MKQLGLDQEYYLKAEFHHLPILQVDEKDKAEVTKLKAETLEKISALGVELTPDEIRSVTGLDNEEY